jgi:ribosomal protein S18 acetylase RimI-like enzyme
MDINLRPVSADDEAFLFALYTDFRSDDLNATNLDAHQRAACLSQQFAAQTSDYGRRFGAGDHHIVERDGQAAGRIWVMRGEDSIHVVDITLLEAHRGNGIGTQLLSQLLREGQASGRSVRLLVLKSNGRALELYGRLGFRVVEDKGIHFVMEGGM